MSATQILPLHFFRSPVCSFFNRRDFMSCCIMTTHRFFCRPRLRRPLTSAVIILFIEFSSSQHMTVSSQSGPSYFVSNACHPNVFLMELFLIVFHYCTLINNQSSFSGAERLGVKDCVPKWQL